MTSEQPSATESDTILPYAEMQRVAQSVEDKRLFGILLGAWVLLFHFVGNSTFGYIDSPSIFKWMYECYTVVNSNDGHGVLVPFMVLFVLWLRREDLLAVKRKTWLPAVGLLAFCAVLHVLGYMIQQPRVSIVAFFGGVYALVGVVWGPGWLKGMFVPFTIFGFCIPMGTLELINKITLPLQVAAASISTWLAHDVLGFEVSRQGTKIVDAMGVMKYEVARGCSGIRSLIALFVLMTVYGIIAYRSPWRRITLMLTSIPLALICNIIRLVLVIMAGEVFGHAAGEFVHEWSGFLTYAMAIGCMMGLSYWWSEKPVSTETLKSNE